MVAIANRYGFACEHIADALQRFFSVVFLDMTNQGVHHGHAQDHQRINPVTHQRRQNRGGEQNVNQDVMKMSQEAQPGRFAFFLRQRVWSHLRQACPGFVVLQP